MVVVAAILTEVTVMGIDSLVELGRRVEQRRLSKRLTRSQLASMIGTRPHCLRSIEYGRPTTKLLELLPLLASALDVSIPMLMNKTESAYTDALSIAEEIQALSNKLTLLLK
ncbi:MAG: hypothetical protein HQK52_08030 [Oligoflexia bacterium]|nr:hypothetical protein [Oligoflexia bacterium]